MTDSNTEAYVEWMRRASASVQHLPHADTTYVTVTLRSGDMPSLLRRAANWIDENESWAVVHGLDFQHDAVSTPEYEVNLLITGDNEII